MTVRNNKNSYGLELAQTPINMPGNRKMSLTRSEFIIKIENSNLNVESMTRKSLMTDKV